MLWQRRAHSLTKEERPFWLFWAAGGGGHMIHAKICLHMAFASPAVNALNILPFYIQM